jgi:putative ABC transport system permease protein
MGATPGRIVRLIFERSGALALAGLVSGLMGAWMATGVLAQFLYAVLPTDAWSFSLAALLLIAAAALANITAALRATRIDPVVALREE